VKLLLDTHAFLWLVEGSPKLSAKAEAALADSNNDAFLSVAAVWELAIKTGGNKLTLRDPLEQFVGKWATTYRIELLPIQLNHALRVASLPNFHRDPFDRLMIAQAIVDDMAILSVEAEFAPYPISIVW